MITRFDNINTYLETIECPEPSMTGPGIVYTDEAGRGEIFGYLHEGRIYVLDCNGEHRCTGEAGFIEIAQSMIDGDESEGWKDLDH